MSPIFIHSFNAIWDYIAIDSKNRANKFKHGLKAKIEALPDMPYMYRQSIYFEDKAVHDLIFKGYVIVYRVDEVKERITVIGIVKYQEGL